MIGEGRRAPDMGMPNQAGNNLLYALVLKAKTERELLSMIDKLALKMGGKYKDAKDELITRAAVEFFQGKGAADLVGGGTIKLDDKSAVKLSKKSAERVIKNLEKQKPVQRLRIQKAMSKNKDSFNRFIKILDV